MNTESIHPANEENAMSGSHVVRHERDDGSHRHRRPYDHPHEHRYGGVTAEAGPHHHHRQQHYYPPRHPTSRGRGGLVDDSDSDFEGYNYDTLGVEKAGGGDRFAEAEACRTSQTRRSEQASEEGGGDPILRDDGHRIDDAHPSHSGHHPKNRRRGAGKYSSPASAVYKVSSPPTKIPVSLSGDVGSGGSAMSSPPSRQDTRDFLSPEVHKNEPKSEADERLLRMRCYRQFE